MMRNTEPQGVCFEKHSRNKRTTYKVPETITSLVCKNDSNQENL